MAVPLLQTFRNIGRLSQIVNTFARYGFKKELQRTELGSLVSSDSAADSKPVVEAVLWPRRMAMAFDELGPTFVKLAQLLASREDLLPEYVTNEFKRLRDMAKPFSYEVLQKVLETEFQGKVWESFESIDPVPVGAASIGQVHFATLKDGRRVVLKVQRPEIEGVIRNDLSILMGVANTFERAFPEFKALRPTMIVDELYRSLMAELDFFREAANTERMRGYFEGHPDVYVPEVFRAYCTRNVLCLEVIDGVKLTTLNQNEDHSRIVTIGVRAFLDMTFKFGVFHGDLHPGNFLLKSDGKLAILDFGLTPRLSRDMRATLAYMFLAIINEDLESFARMFFELTEGGFEVDRDALERDIRDLADTAMSLPFEKLNAGKMLMQVATAAANRHAPVSRELILFFRALIALETFAKSLMPKFQLVREAAAYAETLPRNQLNSQWLERESVFLMRDLQGVLREFPAALKVFGRQVRTGHLGIKIGSDDLRFLGTELDRASNRVAIAIIVAGIVLGSSIVTYGKQGHWFDSLATMGLIGFGLAGILGLWTVFGILRSGKYR